jgi:KDO2-lipid IV(A) lauroyltransferase
MAKIPKRLRHDIAFFAVLFVVFFAKNCPRFLGLRIFGFFGFIFGFLLKKERKITRENLKKAFPDYSDKKIEKITNGVFVNAAVSFFDGVKLPEYKKEKFFKIVQIDDEKMARQILENSTGTIILGSHFSAFELKTQIVAKMGFKAMTIGSRLFDKRVDEVLVKLRKRNGVQYFDRNGGIMSVIRNLKKGFGFGVLVDQDATNDGVFVNFFGEEAWTPFVPIKIALHNKNTLAHMFLVRQKNDKYRLFIEKQDIISTENEMETYILNLEKFNEKLSEYLRKYPEQWVWMHRRWRRKAKDFPPELSISHYKKGAEK